MSLVEHLRELRSRVIRSAGAIALAAVVGWVAYDRIFAALQQPLLDARDHRGTGGLVTLNFAGITDTFSLKLRVAFVTGVLIASPVWIYQVWAFITPGLHRNERRHALTFLAAAVPLFLAGAGLAFAVVPKAVTFLLDFTPTGGSNILDVSSYLGFVLRLILAFGVAFLLPVVVVGLNLVGVLSARAILRAWRISVFLIFVFAAAATPSPDAWSMLLLAAPMVLLYVVAAAIAWVHDRRKAHREGTYTGLSDDEASPLDLPAPDPR